MEKPNWIKEKGYLHISESLTIGKNWSNYKKKIENPKYVEGYAFYPLIHNIIKERKFKKGEETKHTSTDRKHSHKNFKTGKIERSEKIRPIHYASHMDSLVYGYYSKVLGDLYETKLKENLMLDESINAYRKILIENTDKGKSTIHFAKETFDEIKKRSTTEEVSVLTFDIKSFFSSMDHSYLKKKWKWLLEVDELPKDHYNVFKSCTKFKYILLDDLRDKASKRNSFDESKLAKIRIENGFRCFFESNEDFRQTIKDGKLRIYSNPFFNEDGNLRGIPQGLPISATLANIYLYDFDSSIVNEIVVSKNAYYRRYSDDIIIVCNSKDVDQIEIRVNELIKECKVEISKQKTEKFIFKHTKFSTKTTDERLTSYKLISKNNTIKQIEAPLIYLGFEFRGYNTLIKSTNLSKYYRKIISVTKRRCKRAKNLQNKNPEAKNAVYLNQVRKLYNKPLKILDSEKSELQKLDRKRYFLVKNEKGNYEFKHQIIPSKKNSNYYSYVKRCSQIFEDDIFLRQIRKRKHIAYSVISKHLKS